MTRTTGTKRENHMIRRTILTAAAAAGLSLVALPALAPQAGDQPPFVTFVAVQLAGQRLPSPHGPAQAHLKRDVGRVLQELLD